MSKLQSMQEKFEQLLGALTAFFIAETPTSDDKQLLEQIRMLGLALAAEAKNPYSFQRFLAYVLANTTIEARYPLQCIQMLSMVADILRLKELKASERDDVLTAALFCDFGFRAAWIGHPGGGHAGTSVFHLRSFGFPWWSVRVERMILGHHDAKLDLTPSQFFSMIAQYLGMIQGTGIDENLPQLYSPGRAVEMLLESPVFNADAKKHFLINFAIFPVGTWVQLNNGLRGLVIANDSRYPLRPVVAVYEPGEAFGLLKSPIQCKQIDLRKETTVVVTGETAPDSVDQGIFDHADLWIPRWTGKPDPQEEEAISPAEPEAASTSPVDASRPPLTFGRSHASESKPPREASEAVSISNFKTSSTPTPSVSSEQARMTVMPAFTGDETQETESTLENTSAVAAKRSPPPVRREPVFEDPVLTLSPEGLAQLCLTLQKDIDHRVQALEVALHQRTHQSQLTQTLHPKDFRRARNVLQEIRNLAYTLAGLGDTDSDTVRGVVNIWEGDLLAAEKDYQDIQNFMEVYMLPWDAKRDEAMALSRELRAGASSTLSAQRVSEIQKHWQQELKFEIENLHSSLERTWDQKMQILRDRETGVHQCYESAARARTVLIEKISWTYITRAWEKRKAMAWDEAISCCQKALALTPSLWQAHMLIGMCHMESADRQNYKSLKRSNE